MARLFRCLRLSEAAQSLRLADMVRLVVSCAVAVLFGSHVALAQTPSDGGAAAHPPAAKMTPLQRLMKDGIPDNSIERAQLRENLYALLATAPDDKSATKVRQALQQVWLTSGSETIDLLMIRALKAQKAKKDAVSLKLLDAVVDLAPDYAEGWNRRAYIHYKRRDYRAAAGDLRRTLALDPKHFRALSGLGTILTESGDDAGALKVFERLIDINPHDDDAESTYKELKRKVEGRGI
jgi:tetratricopeptide (TPR) repeat protein